jgi:hypothetical protein
LTTSPSKEAEPRPKSGRKVVLKSHVNEALTFYLRTFSVIEDNQEVVSFYKVPEGLDVKIEEIKHD